jgi:hypothetical protein
MNPTDAELFRQACRVADDDPLPACVENAYWDYKWAKDAIDSSSLGLDEICVVIALSGYAKGKGFRPDPTELTPLDLIKSGAVVDGDPILVTWKWGKPITGTFRGYARVRNKVLVQLADEPEPREFEIDRIVGLPQPVEA